MNLTIGTEPSRELESGPVLRADGRALLRPAATGVGRAEAEVRKEGRAAPVPVRKEGRAAPVPVRNAARAAGAGLAAVVAGCGAAAVVVMGTLTGHHCVVSLGAGSGTAGPVGVVLAMLVWCASCCDRGCVRRAAREVSSQGMEGKKAGREYAVGVCDASGKFMREEERASSAAVVMGDHEVAEGRWDSSLKSGTLSPKIIGSQICAVKLSH